MQSENEFCELDELINDVGSVIYGRMMQVKHELRADPSRSYDVLTDIVVRCIEEVKETYDLTKHQRFALKGALLRNVFNLEEYYCSDIAELKKQNLESSKHTFKYCAAASLISTEVLGYFTQHGSFLKSVLTEGMNYLSNDSRGTTLAYFFAGTLFAFALSVAVLHIGRDDELLKSGELKEFQTKIYRDYIDFYTMPSGSHK